MKNMNKVMMVMMMSVMVASSAMAEGHGGKDPTAAPGINKRIKNQKKRIEHKLEKGKITQAEADKLNQNVDAVQAKETELSKDGKLTKEERKGLRQDLNKSGMEIKETGAKTPATGN